MLCRRRIKQPRSEADTPDWVARSNFRLRTTSETVPFKRNRNRGFLFQVEDIIVIVIVLCLLDAM